MARLNRVPETEEQSFRRGREGPFEWWSIVGRKEGDRGREKERERGIAAKSVADWRPKARLQIPGVMPVIRGFGAQ